jgi:hypothetical protein
MNVRERSVFSVEGRFRSSQPRIKKTPEAGVSQVGLVHDVVLVEDGAALVSAQSKTTIPMHITASSMVLIS